VMGEGGGARSKQHPMTGNALCTMHKDGLMHNNFALLYIV
jgi:hypothetical protein